MTEETNQHRWQEGHPRYGGRKKRTAAQARAMAEEMGIDPIQFLLSVIKSDSIETTVIEGGKKKRVTITVPLETRIDCAKYVSRFCYPVLSATQVTGADEGPVAVVGMDMTAIMRDPAMVDAAQRLSLLMARPDALPAPADGAPPLGAPPARDPLDTITEKDARGHWMPR